MIKREDITIIIPHFGASPESEYAFEQCIQSLDETEPTIKKVVVKNGPVCKHHGDIVTDPQGQCRAVNEGVKLTKTPWIMVTNDDMIYPPGWFEKLTDISWFGEKEPLCVSPMLVEPRPGAPTFYTHFCGGAGGDFNKEKFLDFAKEWNVATPNKWRTGFNLPFIIKRELWDVIGGYDEKYDPWSSNSDSCLEYCIRLAGVQPYQNKNAVVYHFSQTSGTFEPRNQSYWQKNWQYFIDKWGFPRTDEGIWEANFKIPLDQLKFNPEWKGKYGEIN